MSGVARLKGSRYERGRNARRLFQENARAFDLLRAQRAEKIRNEAVHQLEVRRQRRWVLLRVVENLFAIALRVHRRAGAAVDEHELRAQDEAFALLISPCRHDAAAADAY